MVKKSINSVNNYIEVAINNKFNEIVNQIMIDYKINFNIQAYNDNNKSIGNNSFYELINDVLRCQARVKSGCQCKRSKKNSTHFCKIHQKNCKFGMVKYYDMML